MNRWMKGSLAVSGTALVAAFISKGSILATSVCVAMMGVVLFAQWFSNPAPDKTRYGQTLRGTEVSDKKKRGFKPASDKIQIGGIPIARDVEPQHFLLTGAPGTGKTVVAEAVMDTIRERGQRCIVYDSTGEFVSHYYREGKDVILSPIDKRSALWSPWAEGTDAYSYENLAAALIPDGQGENQFWAQAARAIFRAVLASTTDLSALIDLIFAADQELLLACLQAQGLAGLAGPSQMLASSRGEAATYIQPLSYLPSPSSNPFSIRDWIKQDSGDSWLFVSSRADSHRSIRPLLSMWLGLAVQATMSLPPSRDRRLWFVLDELPTLQKLPSLDLLLAGGRKYGAAALLGVQTVAQVRDGYGRDAASAILSHPSTRLSLRVGDHETADYLSKSIGDRHMVRKVASESTGGSGGSSVGEQHAIEAAVLPSEILSLPNLIGYLRVANNPILKKVRLAPVDRKQIAAPYEDRALGTPPPVPVSPSLPGAQSFPARTMDAPSLDDGPDGPGDADISHGRV
ncbi:MAG: type IV secretion system DNA-binding domain-containing protein [Acidithiobacillus sp.]